MNQNTPEQSPSTRSWQWVKRIAQLVTGDDFSLLQEVPLKQKLLAEGAVMTEIDQAFDWIEKATAGGRMVEILNLIASDRFANRFDHPLEKMMLNKQAWEKLHRMRARALLPNQTFELVIESARAFDMRDWDEEDIDKFFSDLIESYTADKQASGPFLSTKDLSRDLLC